MQPRKVSQATANLRTVNDTVGLFLAGECVLEPDVKISRMAMNETFEKWCDEEGYRYKISKKKLFAALRELGVIDGGKSGTDRFWSGIRWRNEAEWIAAEQAAIGQDILGV